MSLLWFLLIGAVAGWIAGLLVRGGGFGLLGNMIVGVLGAIVGGYLFSVLGIASGSGTLGSLITAVVGASAFLFVLGLLRTRR